MQQDPFLLIRYGAAAMRSYLPDERKSERVALALPIRYAYRSGRQMVRGQSVTTDLSGQGVKFLTPLKLFRGSACQIALKIPRRARSLVFEGRVTRCRALMQKPRAQFEIAVSIRPHPDADEAMFGSYCHFIATQLLTRYFRR